MLGCPFCDQPLAPTDTVCPNPDCQLYLPTSYQEVCRTRPPLDVVIAGYSGHGKSEFLLSLFLTLNGLPQKVDGSELILDGATEAQLRQFLEKQQKGEKVDSTKVGDRQRVVFGLLSMPPLSDRFVRLFDTAGEVYKERQAILAEAPRLGAADALWLVHSPADQVGIGNADGMPTAERSTERLDLLLDAVHSALQVDGHAPTEANKRPLVVVFTKGDKLSDRLIDLSPEIGAVWDEGNPFANLNLPGVAGGSAVDLADHLAKVRRSSEVIRAAVSALVPQFGAFVSKARRMNYTVSYTLVSSLGQDYAKGFTRKPKRVLDPLLLTLDERRAPPLPAVAVAFDPAGGDALAKLVRGIAGKATITAYRLGGGGQPVPLPAPGVATGPAALRLIGPTLHALPPSTPLLVLTAGPVLDLPDFACKEPTPAPLAVWRKDFGKRVAVARLDGGADRWANALPVRPTDDMAAVARQLLALVLPTTPNPA